MGDVSEALLDRRLYTIRDAADLLDMPPSTLQWWLQGRVTRTATHLPALRQEPNDDPHVTWGEFIEANLLRQLRNAGVDLNAIRVFSRAVRLAKGWQYPLARHDIWAGANRDLVYEAQQLSGIEGDAALLVAGEEYGRGQQVLQLGETASLFLKPIEFAGDIPIKVHPDEEAWEVVVDVRRRFGAPQVAGVPTEALWSLHEAGESVGGIAEGFGLTVEQVTAAVGYEQRHRGTAVAA